MRQISAKVLELGAHVRRQIIEQQDKPNPITFTLLDGRERHVWLATGKDGKKKIGDELWWGVNCSEPKKK